MGYPVRGAETGIAALIDEERRAAFDSQTTQHFETHYFLTLVYMPGADVVATAGQALVETIEDTGVERDWKRELEAFTARTNSIADLFAGFMPLIAPLDDAETLTYLHGTISTKRHQVAVRRCANRPVTPLTRQGSASLIALSTSNRR